MQSIIIRVNIGYYFFLCDLPKIKNSMALYEMFLNTGPYGAGISKRYSSYSFHVMSPKLYEDTGLSCRIHAVTFLGSRPSFKKM